MKASQKREGSATHDPQSEVGVIVGRFQSDEVTDGHVALLNLLNVEYEDGIVFIGVRPKASCTKRDPLSFEICKSMVSKLVHPFVTILPLVDCGSSDTPSSSDIVWSKKLDEAIEKVFPGRKAVLLGGRDSFISHYRGKHSTREVSFGIDVVSATERRKQIGKSIIDSTDFRRGVIWATQNTKWTADPTVDIALVRASLTNSTDYKLIPVMDQVLLGRKKDENKFRFIGGHVDPEDDSLEFAARRELMEETGFTVEGDLEYIGSCMVPDWRGPKISAFYLAEYSFGYPEPASDIVETRWAPINSDLKKLVVEDHHCLVDLFLKFMEKRSGT